MNKFVRFGLLLGIITFFEMAVLPRAASAQQGTAEIRGQVTDPSGAVISQAQVTVTGGQGKATTATADGSGAYQVRGLAPGGYTVTVQSPGFTTAATPVTLGAGQVKTLNLAMQIAVEQQQVQVEAHAPTVDTSPEDNANAMVITGKDLDALSDDPDEMENELQALAGPAAGPNGGEIYIDGFTGGQIPPKTSIREIRVNQNPFSAEYDRLGYGRIEIFTKPGTDKTHGQIEARGNDSAFNTRNPILQTPEPSYYSYNLQGSVGGPLTKSASYFFSVFARNIQNVNVIDAINPASITPTDPNGINLNEPYPNPSSRIDVSPRIDLQLGKANTLTIRYDFFREVQSNEGVGQLALPEQGTNVESMENTLQLSDSLVLSKNFIDDINFQYRRFRTQQIPLSTLPQVTVQGSFTDGGANGQITRDNQDMYELQNYFAGAKGSHSLNFGARLRAYRDANFTNAGSNGAYTFKSIPAYLSLTPQTFAFTVINRYTARAILFDAGLFYQDDWKVSPRFTFSYGLRWETQNLIQDKSDWAPRVSFAYALGKTQGRQPPKTVLRGGYGWFYERFTVPNSFGSLAGTPYIINTIHQNGFNQINYIATDPVYPARPIPSAATAPTVFNVDPHFRSANDMQAAIGVDRQIAKRMTGNVTYLYGRGVHQYLTNNIGAPDFATAFQGIYPNAPLPPAQENIDQYQAGGVYRQTEIIGSLRATYPRFSFVSFYTYNNAKADTNGVAYTPSVAQNPGLDYGRATFDIRNRFLIFGNVSAPYGIALTPFLSYNSGTPYNVTIGSDLTRNNTFAARPTYAANCNEPNVVRTAQFGCLNFNPFGTNEKIVPFDLGTGPANVSINLRVSKVIGLGPRIEGGAGPGGGGPGGGGRGGGGPRGGGGGLGAGGLSGARGGPGRMATSPHKYNLTLTAYATNLFNHENLGAPNGTLGPQAVNSVNVPQQFFGKSQQLAGGFFGPTTAGNRSIFLQAVFNF